MKLLTATSNPYSFLLLLLLCSITVVPSVNAFSPIKITTNAAPVAPPSKTVLNSHDAVVPPSGESVLTRRRFGAAMSVLAGVTPLVPAANAAPDCMKDCLKNCKEIAPKDTAYCLDNCKSYCDQPDREDGLSGSKSSAKGETGILGTTTVVKGEDRPPSVKLPGLNFNTESGKKLLGY
eukprot:CAMPEP_0172500858 /NCGR_PEP_ID=MMETSP1066-20121228/143952_1 /TAXON_ID=671091 /ORGANISM="Coscinodiscus wailesii, Strain CCMP2513" /LENGTH=177 /DNA_ID=CAMNT_0013275339 /DNA_START=120 /DNA_END=653 /DNA_ORIENTATION=-